MLALNSHVIREGSFSSPQLAINGAYLLLPAIESGAVIAHDALFRTLVEIEKMYDSVSRNEDSPTQDACNTAKQLLCEAQNKRPIFAMASVIEGSEGDLLIHWDTPGKGVVLICPGRADKTAQIYREELAGKVATHSEIANASAESLAEALAWVLLPR